MAKLRARGREEIFRVAKVTPSGRDGVAEIHHFRALASDGNVLERMVVHYTPEETAKNYGRKQHDYGWKVRGRARSGLTLEQLLNTYLQKGWTLASASPSYFDVQGDTIQAISQAPFIMVETAEKRRRLLGQQREKAETVRRAKAASSDGPGFYVTNGYTGSIVRSRVADHPKPFASYEEAEEFALERYRRLSQMSLDYLLPVLVIESESRRDAEQNQGSILWVNGKYRGPTVDPRQTSLF